MHSPDTFANNKGDFKLLQLLSLAMYVRDNHGFVNDFGVCACLLTQILEGIVSVISIHVYRILTYIKPITKTNMNIGKTLLATTPLT